MDFCEFVLQKEIVAVCKFFRIGHVCILMRSPALTTFVCPSAMECYMEQEGHSHGKFLLQVYKIKNNNLHAQSCGLRPGHKELALKQMVKCMGLWIYQPPNTHVTTLRLKFHIYYLES